MGVWGEGGTDEERVLRHDGGKRAANKKDEKEIRENNRSKTQGVSSYIQSRSPPLLLFRSGVLDDIKCNET